MAKIYEKCENPGDGIQASPGHPGIFYNFPPPEIHAAPFICCSHTKIDCFDMWLIFGVAEMWLIFCVRLEVLGFEGHIPRFGGRLLVVLCKLGDPTTSATER